MKEEVNVVVGDIVCNPWMIGKQNQRNGIVVKTDKHSGSCVVYWGDGIVAEIGLEFIKVVSHYDIDSLLRV